MTQLWKAFVRVLRTYSVEEKIISIIVFGIVIFTAGQAITDHYKGSGISNQEGGGFTEGIISDKPLVLNPLFVDLNDSSRDITTLIFSGLSKYDPSKRAFIDDLATLTISPDKTTYRFTLKPNVLWHDGHPVTSEDIFYTFHDVIQNPAFQNPLLKVDFDGVEVKKIDAETVEFKLKNPNTSFITNMNIGLLPKHILENTPADQLLASSFNMKPIGSGPYKVDAPVEVFDDGRERVTLKTFGQYYGQTPAIHQIRFSEYPDFDSLLKEIGTINIIAKIPGSNVSQLQSSAGRFSFMNYELPQYTAIFLNIDRDLIRQDKVRIALAKAINKAELIKLFNDKIAVDTPLLELNQEDWIYKTNIDDAKNALKDAGYKQDKEKAVDKNGKQLEIVLLARAYEKGTPLEIETQKTLNFLSSEWGKIGIKMNIQLADSDSYLSRLQTRDYDMALAGQRLGYNLDTYSYWHSSQATPAGLNLSNYKSFAVDQLIEKIRETFDTAEKDKNLKQLAKVISTDIPAIFLYRPRYTFATDNKVQGIDLTSVAYPSDRFESIATWCISCNKTP